MLREAAHLTSSLDRADDGVEKDIGNRVHDVGRFATFLRRSPDTATVEDLRRFQVEQQETGVPVPTMSTFASALRFFFTHTLDRPDLARRLVRLAHPRKLR